jgi:hypothetical protein
MTSWLVLAMMKIRMFVVRKVGHPVAREGTPERESQASLG